MTPDAPTLYERALALTNARKYLEADAALIGADEAAEDDELRARIAGTHAYVLDRLGRPDEAIALCQTVLARTDLTPHTRGVLQGQLATVLVNRGRLGEAMHWFEEAISALGDDPFAAANLRMNRSLVAMQMRDLPAAIDDLEQAVAAFEQHAEPVDVAEARHNLGYTALLGGDLVRAMREMGAARPVIAAASEANAAIGDVDMAEALRDAGLVTEAERLLRQAAQAFRENGMPQARAEAELQLARSLLRHDPVEAAQVAGVAARHFASLDADAWADRARGIRLRALLSGGAVDRSGRVVSDPVVDIAEVGPVATRLARAGWHADASALRLSLELWRARHSSPAGRMPRVDDTAPLEVRILAHEVRAERAARRGDDAEARRHAASGLDELSAWRSSFGSLDLQTSLTMYSSALMLGGLAAAVRSGRPDVVFDWSERARHMSLQVVPLRPPADTDQAAELAELRMLRADAGDQWASEPRAQELGERLRRRQWTTFGAAEIERPVDLAAARAALGDDTAMICFVFSGERMSALVVTARDARLVPLPGWNEARKNLPALRSDLDMSAAVRTGPMMGIIRRSLDDHLGRLSDALVADALSGIDARRLVITAPGVLAGLPWTMLPALAGRAVTVAASATRWVHDRGVVTGMEPLRAGFAVGPRVARGAEEVETAAASWRDARVLLDEDAAIEAVVDEAARSDVLHLSAHGRHALDNPLFAGLQLSDGVLFGYDVDRMPRVPATVILSACESGRSAVRWGEESVGMTRAWLHAGARTVIAAPVVVADGDACELLGALHTGLAEGAPPAIALARAAEETGIRAPFLCHGSGF